MRKWDEVDLREGMLDPKRCADGSLVSSRVRWQGCLVSGGDVVVFRGAALEVRGAYLPPGDDEPFLVAVPHSFAESPAPGAAYWRPSSEQPELVALDRAVRFEIPQWFSDSGARGLLTLF